MTMIGFSSLSLLMVLLAQISDAFSNIRMSSLPDDVRPPKKVIVTGAAGRTGKLVFSKLNNNPLIKTIGLVRTEQSAKKLMNENRKQPNAVNLDQLVVCDVTSLTENNIPQGLQGAEAMVICTSAVPRVSKYSTIKAILKVPINLLTRKKAINFRSLTFKYKPGQYPEKVDYEGQKKQIDLAWKLGIDHVVVVSSMGGTDPNNYLNSIGKNKDGTGNGDILLWKRKAEQYLVDSGLHYTILHPGGLRDTPGNKEQFLLDVNDKFINRERKFITREDVANLCVAALTVGRNRNASFDCITRDLEGGENKISAEDALRLFLETGKTTDYSL